MKQTRNSIFETNSSSTHSLVLNIPDNLRLFLKMELDDNGYIVVDGWDQTSNYRAFGFYEKLAYMLSWIYLSDETNPYFDDDDTEYIDFAYPRLDGTISNDSFDRRASTILDVINEEFPEVNGLRLTNIQNINWDHQTMPYESDFVIDLHDPQAINGYLFNDDAIVIVGRD